MQLPLSYTLDIPTLTVALAAVYAGSLFMALLLYAYHRFFPGALFWIVGQALLAAGALVMAFQSLGLPYEILAASNVSMLAGVMFFGHAIWKFRFGRGFPIWSYILIPVSFFVWIAMKNSPTGLRVIIFSGLLCVMAATIAALLLVHRNDEHGNIQNVSAVFFIAVSTASLVRVISAALRDPMLTPIDSGAISGPEYLLALFIGFLNLFGYFLLSFAQVEQDLRTHEKETALYNLELEETLSTKDALIAVIGHDLRAPVSSANRYVHNHLLDFKGDLNTKRESIETLSVGLERISGLLDSLFEWALCASGRITLQQEPLRVEEVLAEAAADIAPIAKAKGVTLAIPAGGGTIAADRRALATVFRNIISNAVKYSQSGSPVQLVVSRTSSNKKDEQIVITIEDSGVGMKPDQLQNLFIPGRTLLTLGTGGEQGNGFGLAISKLFVEKMQGHLRVESVLGSGTRFMLDFPNISPL
jgi:signal transduction histidine kinase